MPNDWPVRVTLFALFVGGVVSLEPGKFAGDFVNVTLPRLHKRRSKSPQLLQLSIDGAASMTLGSPHFGLNEAWHDSDHNALADARSLVFDASSEGRATQAANTPCNMVARLLDDLTLLLQPISSVSRDSLTRREPKNNRLPQDAHRSSMLFQAHRVGRTAAAEACGACNAQTACEEKILAPGAKMTECSPTPSAGMGFTPKIAMQSGGTEQAFTLKLYAQADPSKQWPTDTCTGIDKCDKPTTCLEKSKPLGNSEDKVICADIGCEAGVVDCLIKFSIVWEEEDVVKLAKQLMMIKLIAGGAFFVFIVLPLTVGFCFYRDSIMQKLGYGKADNGAGKGAGKSAGEHW